jgi:hypothetical protein
MDGNSKKGVTKSNGTFSPSEVSILPEKLIIHA